MSFIRAHKIEIGIFILALVLRFLYLDASIAHYGGVLTDAIHGADGYFEVSHNLIIGHGFTQSQSPPYIPYSFRPPLFFYFIYWFHTLFNGYWGVIILQMILGSALPIIGMKLASYALNSRKLIITIGLLLALDPQGILYSTFFYSEILFIFLFFLSLLYLFRYSKKKNFYDLIISGGVLGLACLTRPAIEYLPIIIAACLLWDAREYLSKKFFLHVGTYLLVFAAVISPWIYRNYVTFGVADLSPQLGVNLYAVLLPSVLAVEHGTSWQQEFAILTRAGVQGPNVADITKGGEYTKLALPLLLAHPKALAIVEADTAVSFFTSDGVLDTLRHIGASTNLRLGEPALFMLLSSPRTLFWFIAQVAMTPTIFVLFGRIFWFLATGMFLYGAWRYLRREPRNLSALIMIAVVLYFALTTTLVSGFGITSRYRLPVNVFILVFAAYAVSVLISALRRKRRGENA